jgi:hypothetical protein
MFPLKRRWKRVPREEWESDDDKRKANKEKQTTYICYITYSFSVHVMLNHQKIILQLIAKLICTMFDPWYRTSWLKILQCIF